jgi:hypothetical protein
VSPQTQRGCIIALGILLVIGLLAPLVAIAFT